MEPGIKSLYQEPELKGPEVVVRVMLGIGATKSHKSGSIAIAIGNHCWRQAKIIEKRDQEMPRKHYPRDTKGLRGKANIRDSRAPETESVLCLLIQKNL